MTNCCTSASVGTSRTIGHHVEKNSPHAIVRSTRLTYIGFRVYRYGPDRTRAPAGRIGTMLVCERRKRPMLRNARAIQPRRRKTPAMVVSGPEAIGKGPRRSSRTPVRTPSPYHSGGGNLTPRLSYQRPLHG